jgi:hypothetical protein
VGVGGTDAVGDGDGEGVGVGVGVGVGAGVAQAVIDALAPADAPAAADLLAPADALDPADVLAPADALGPAEMQGVALGAGDSLAAGDSDGRISIVGVACGSWMPIRNWPPASRWKWTDLRFFRFVCALASILPASVNGADEQPAMSATTANMPAAVLASDLRRDT